ncbi:ADP-ribosylation [Gymnopus androsaceus JB14]|uniref:ADP-ribosylation n=1 Tax=Gymnopus androsaceus JB14 TaxID=1447944 RepID=A0A6A4H9W4_9AGAR|nr:ADP-ribosylation [Gymnopus androsaceus JB14]
MNTKMPLKHPLGCVEGTKNDDSMVRIASAFFGNYGQTEFCDSETCSLCSIIRTSFDLSHFGMNWGRFGRGIYTTSTSSKANDYSRNLQTSWLKAMLLNNVVVGKGYKKFYNDEDLTEPPSGYDSVIGEPSLAGDLNYDELVVYTNDAIRPSFLVMYKS